MDNNETKIVIAIIVMIGLTCLGLEGCVTFSNRQFAEKGYCNSIIKTDTSLWFKCDSLNELKK